MHVAKLENAMRESGAIPPADSGMKTRLPNLEQHVAATNGCSLFSGLYAPNAFHQCALTEEGKNLFGFCVPDRTGVMAFYRYTGCPFGFHSLPGLFQERMEAILAGACEAGTTSVAQAFIDDTLICTAGRNGTRLSEVWGEDAPSPQETEIIVEHIRVLGRALDGYLQYGMVVKLTKCELLREEIGVCGILCDGLSRRIDPSRVDGWANLGRPAGTRIPRLHPDAARGGELLCTLPSSGVHEGE